MKARKALERLARDQRGTAAVEFAIVAAAVIPAFVFGGYEMGPVLHDYALQLVAATKDACAAIEAGGGQC